MKAYFLHESLNKDQSGMCGAVLKSLMENGMQSTVDVPLDHPRAAEFRKAFPEVASKLKGRGPFLVLVGPNAAKVYNGPEILKVIKQMTHAKQNSYSGGPGMPVAPDSVAQPMFQDALYSSGGQGLAHAIDETGVYATNFGLDNNTFESPNQLVRTRGNPYLERTGHLPPSARPEPAPLVRCEPWRVGNRGYPCFKDGQSLAVADGMEVPLLAGPNNWKSHFFNNVTIGGIYTGFGPYTTPNSFDPDDYNHPFLTAFKRGNQEQSQRQFGDATSYHRSYLSFE